MKKDPCQSEIKAIKLLQDRASAIDGSHSKIGSDLNAIKEQLAALGGLDVSQSSEFLAKKDVYLQAMSRESALAEVKLSDIYLEAESSYQESLSISEILTVSDWKYVEDKLDRRIYDFNLRHSLDKWDYAIAGSCGLFAAMLDLLCVKAPPKPTVKWDQEIDGIFNEWVRNAFNKVLPPDISESLSKGNPIGAPDSSVITDLIGAPPKVLNPINHRLRSLAHDPVLGFIFGVWDMMNGTCTVVVNGEIQSFPSVKGSTDGNIFQLLGRMFGHLLSDVNAPSANGNRGMGLPAPFMGILRMFEGIPVGDSNFGKQIEWMYVNGYDFRQFVVSSVPMAIMEVLLRAFYVIKQMKLYDAPFGESILDTMPTKMNPRFRIMLALSYGTSSAVNAGKVYVTKNILNANYASWMGLAWNGFHALKWALLDRQLKLWGEIEAKEIKEIEDLITDLDRLSIRASHLPV
jgi:hypothetical protein